MFTNFFPCLFKQGGISIAFVITKKLFLPLQLENKIISVSLWNRSNAVKTLFPFRRNDCGKTNLNQNFSLSCHFTLYGKFSQEIPGFWFRVLTLLPGITKYSFSTLNNWVNLILRDHLWAQPWNHLCELCLPEYQEHECHEVGPRWGSPLRGIASVRLG